MVLTLVPILRNSPFKGLSSISSRIFFVKSPSATAEITRPTSVVGCAKLLISPLIESIFAFHIPVTVPTDARSVSFPSSPTILPTLTISLARPSFRLTTSLNIMAISDIIPPLSVGSLTEKSPCLTALSAFNSLTLSLWTALRSIAPPSASVPPSSRTCSSFPVSSKNTDLPGLRVSLFVILIPPSR